MGGRIHLLVALIPLLCDIAYAQSWEAIAPMRIPRAEVRSSTLPDGRILIVGGRNGFGNPIGECEIYDPKTNTWTEAGSLNVARYRFSLETMDDGRVIVSGGLIGPLETTETREIFNPATERWIQVADLLDARQNFPSTLTKDGNLIYCGGMFSSGPVRYLTSTEIYNPKTDIVRRLPDMPIAFYGNVLHYSPILNGVIATGGLLGGTSGTYLKSSIMLSFDDTLWTEHGELAEPHANGAGQDIQLHNGTIVVPSGRTGQRTVTRRVEVFDDFTRAWKTAGSLLRPHWHAKTIQIGGDSILVIGGVADPDIYQDFIADCSWFNFRNNTSTAGPIMLQARAYFAASLVTQRVESRCDQKDVIYVFGGETRNNVVVNTAEKLDLGLRPAQTNITIVTPVFVAASDCNSSQVAVDFIVDACEEIELKTMEIVGRENAIVSQHNFPIQLLPKDTMSLNVAIDQLSQQEFDVLKLTFNTPSGEEVRFVHITNSSGIGHQATLQFDEPTLLEGSICDGASSRFTLVNPDCDEIVISSVTIEGKDKDNFRLGVPIENIAVGPADSIVIEVNATGGEGAWEAVIKIDYILRGTQRDTTFRIMSSLTSGNATIARTLMSDVQTALAGDFLTVPLNLLLGDGMVGQGYELELNYDTDLLEMIEPEFMGTITPASLFDLTHTSTGARLFVPTVVTLTSTEPLIKFRFRSFVAPNKCTQVKLRKLVFSPDDPKFTTCVMSVNLDSAMICVQDQCGDPALRRVMAASDEQIGNIIYDRDRITVAYESISDVSFEMYDMLGQQVSSHQVSMGPAIIPTHNLAAGAYILRMTTPFSVRSRRISILR